MFSHNNGKDREKNPYLPNFFEVKIHLWNQKFVKYLTDNTIRK